jgi:sterol desaturase/sphingolipid hydroxylase (fatty acid hydroxylase superfamily)
MLVMMTFGVVLPLVLPVEWIANHRLMNGEWLGVAGGVVVGFTVFQLVVYAYHRACHSVPFMWRAFHQMHHAPQRIDIPGAVIFHPLELVMQNVIGIGVTVFVLGLDPLAAAIIGYLGAFYGLFQHWNIRTPAWLGYVIQRPESHCHHHELNVHAYNYADLPIWDIVFGTFRNPDTFEGKVGFAEKASFSKMLIGIDVNEGQDAGQPGGKLVPALMASSR